MNIYIFNWRDIRHPLSGGAELSLWEHAKFWQKNGATIHWFSSAFDKSLSTETIDNIQITRRGSHFTVHLEAFKHFRKVNFTKQDIIIDSFHFLPYFTPLYIKKAKKIALINETARGVWFRNISFPLSLIGYLLEPLFFIPYKGISFITGSESAKLDVMKFGIDEGHISIINHGFNPPAKTFLKKKEKNPTILFLSRLTPDKGIEDAINAVSSLVGSIPKLQFWIGGKAENEEYLQKLKELVRAKNLQRITTFYGYVTEKQKYELFSRAWALVHPSMREGWGLNVIEANACGTPAVAYSVAGLVDSIKNNKTGVLVGKKEYSNLAKGLQKIMTDDSLRKRLESNTQKWSNNFSWEKAGRQSWHVITRKTSFS